MAALQLRGAGAEERQHVLWIGGENLRKDLSRLIVVPGVGVE